MGNGGFMRIFSMIVIGLSVMLSQPALAEGIEEIFVTANRSSDDLDRFGDPAVIVYRNADFLVISVSINNDSLKKETREKELRATLRNMLSEVAKTKGITAAYEDQYVKPLDLNNFEKLPIRNAGREVSAVSFYLKSPISKSETKETAEKKINRLRKFVKGIKPVERSLIYSGGSTRLTITNPARFRYEVIEAIAKDLKRITNSFDGKYTVEVRGMSNPLQWEEGNLYQMALFIPYKYELTLVEEK